MPRLILLVRKDEFMITQLRPVARTLCQPKSMSATMLLVLKLRRQDEPKAEPTVIKSDSQKARSLPTESPRAKPKAKPTNISTSKVKMHRTLIASGDNNKREDATVTVVSSNLVVCST